MNVCRSNSGSGSGILASRWANAADGASRSSSAGRVRRMGIIPESPRTAVRGLGAWSGLLQVLAEPGDFLIRLGHERVELGHFPGVLPLLVLAEPEQVRLVLRPP